MRTIKRDIVGAVIISSDAKVLLGHNRKGGVFDSQWVVPGGGIEDGETKEEALRREMLEEIGLDVSSAAITFPASIPGAKAEKTLRETGERVIVDMTFYDAVVRLAAPADTIKLTFEDDYEGGEWFDRDALQTLDIAGPTRARLIDIGLID